MPSYTTLIVLGLVASNVSLALSAPLAVRRDREQSLGHRRSETDAAPSKKGSALKKYGKQFFIGAVATAAFSYVFEKMNGSGGESKGSRPPPTTYAAPPSPNTVNNPYPAYQDPTYVPSNYPTYSTSPDSTYSTSTNPTYSTSTNPTYSTSTYPTYPPTTNPTQTQNGYQQRTVDRDLPADMFEARSTSDNNNQNRQTASLDLSSRGDLVEAIRLFSRMLDELD